MSLGIKGWEQTRLRVLERDSWVCQLCGKPIDPKGRNASVDHIVPRARGGGHEDYNLRAAHRYCNSKRGGRQARGHRIDKLPRANVSSFD